MDYLRLVMSAKEADDRDVYIGIDIITVEGVDKLIKKRKTEDDSILYFVPNEDLFTKINEVHVSNGHLVFSQVMVILKKKYANITAECVKLCISLCDECAERRFNNSSSK